MNVLAVPRNLAWAVLLAGVVLGPLQAEEQAAVDNAVALVQEARCDLVAANPGAAEPKLRAACELQPQWLAPHQWLALVRHLQGDRAGALQEYLAVQSPTYDFCPLGRSNPPEARDAILQAEALTMWLINDTRLREGVPLLRPEPRLSVVARGHSLEMRDLDYFDHESPNADQARLADRFRFVFALLPRVIAVNIGRYWGNHPVLDEEHILAIHQDFLNSEEHRRNLLLPDVTSFGVGVAADAQGAFWLTEDLVEYQEPK